MDPDPTDLGPPKKLKSLCVGVLPKNLYVLILVQITTV